MANYLLGILGILVSVFLFLIGYRQTIGARKERIVGANAHLERTLVRRVVLEKHRPSQVELSRLIEGKARDYRVRPSDLLSESQLVNTIYTRVTESELIPGEQREEILERIAPALAAYEGAPMREEMIEAAADSKLRNRSSEWTAIFLGTLASIVGALVTIVPEFRTLQGRIAEILPTFAAAIVASLALVTVTYAFLRLRSSQEDAPSKGKEVSSYLAFESQVRRWLREAGFEIQSAGSRDSGFDFEVERAGRKILVEVKEWPRAIPPDIVRRVVDRLRAAAKSMGSEAIIVTKNPVRNSAQLAAEPDVKFVTLDELKAWVGKPAA